MTTPVTGSAVLKLQQVLPQLRNGKVSHLSVRPNEGVTEWVEGPGLELPVTPEITFDQGEWDEIAQWIDKESVLVGFKESCFVTPAVNLKGILFGIWKHQSDMIRVRQLDYRKLTSESLVELDFKPTSRDKAEERLNDLAQEIYGERIAELNDEDREDFDTLVKEILGD